MVGAVLQMHWPKLYDQGPSGGVELFGPVPNEISKVHMTAPFSSNGRSVGHEFNSR